MQFIYFLRKDQFFRLRLTFCFSCKKKILRLWVMHCIPFFFWSVLNQLLACIKWSHWTFLFHLSGRPGIFNMRDRAKWDAWKAVEGLLRLCFECKVCLWPTSNRHLHICYSCLNREIQGWSHGWLHHQGEAAAGGGCCIHFLGYENTIIRSAAYIVI